MISVNSILHSVASSARVYDLIQRAAGSQAVNRVLTRNFNGFRSAGWVVDLGGGTGIADEFGVELSRYVCTDIDRLKLEGFRRKHPSGLAVRADALHLPIRDRSVDVVMCKAVSHHLDDESLPQAFAEAARVLKLTGRLVFLDAIAAPARLRSRLLWRFDRGSHPRSEADIRTIFESKFEVEKWTRFAFHHEYLLAIGVPRAASSASNISLG